MNKIIIILFAMVAVLPHPAWGQNDTNYVISINGQTYDISLGRDYQIKSDSGETINFRVNKKAVMTYKNGYTSFQHKSDLAVSSTDLGRVNISGLPFIILENTKKHLFLCKFGKKN